MWDSQNARNFANYVWSQNIFVQSFGPLPSAINPGFLLLTLKILHIKSRMETKYLKNVWNLLVWIRCRYIKGSKSQISNKTFQQLSLHGLTPPVKSLPRRCFYCQDRDSWSALSLFDQPHFLEPEIWEIFAAAVRSSTSQGLGTGNFARHKNLKIHAVSERIFSLCQMIAELKNNMINALYPPQPSHLKFVLLVNFSLEHSHVLRCWLVGKDCKVDRVAPHSISQPDFFSSSKLTKMHWIQQTILPGNWWCSATFNHRKTFTNEGLWLMILSHFFGFTDNM